MHLPALVQDLGIILIAAGIVTLFFKRIGQPVVLGYLLAGFLVGPEVSFLPTIQERDAIRVWAEIGVIFLLFGLGLEFSFKKLLAVGKGATVTAFTEVLFMLGLGYFVGQAFGWSSMDSLFLGGILSISSTTIIIRAFDELGFRQRRFVQLVFGVLIVEDLVAVLLLVLLSTVSITQSFEGLSLLMATAKLGFFLSIWFVGGIFLIPWFMRRIRPLMNEETSLIVSIGLCLLMVILATKAGFSPALGAFVMGSILAETPDGERIENTLRSVRDLFAAIFFVSVGMLIEIEPLKDHWVAVIVITFVTIVGKMLSTTMGALMGGQSIKSSVQSGLSLAQIGEFSFIIATLGLSLGVISNFLYPLAVAVSAITTLTTPYMIKNSDRFYQWLHLRLPQSLINRGLDNVRVETQSIPASLAKGPFIRLFFNTVIVVAIGFAGREWLMPFVEANTAFYEFGSWICLFVSLTLASPFLWAVVRGSDVLEHDHYRLEDVRALTSQALLAFGSRTLLSLFLLAFLVAQFVSALWALVLVIIIAALGGLLGAKNFSRFYRQLETRFIQHLNEKESKKNQKVMPALAPWDAHLSKIEVNPDSSFIGRTLAEIGVREKFGVTIAMIERGHRQLLAPKRDDVLMPFDKLISIGTDDQLTNFARVIESESQLVEVDEGVKYELQLLVLDADKPWVGRSIRESGLREAVDGLVVGLERAGERILNPDSSVQFQIGDLVWLVGNTEKIKALSLQSANLA